ncbi:glycosyltransferase [Chloroflexota bacterium]
MSDTTLNGRLLAKPWCLWLTTASIFITEDDLQLNRIKPTATEKTPQSPTADGIVYSRRRGICPTNPPFVHVPIEDYAPLVGEEKMERLRRAVAGVKGIKILELNSTPLGGGVAEMLLSSVPFLNQLGVDDEWRVIRGSGPFFEVTKCIHNMLQGKGGCFTSDMERIYFETLAENSNGTVLDYEPDVVIAHDPQPLGLAPSLRASMNNEGKWVWRCHIDMDEDSLRANSDLERFMDYWVESYDSAIFSAAQYIICRWPLPKFIIPPFIDPLSEKNRELTPAEILSVLEKHEIEPSVPIIAQIGRFDPWKGILNTIEVYKLVKENTPCQLVLAGGTAADDPEGAVILHEVRQKAKRDPGVHILNLPPTSSLEINAIQRASRVILQPSIREGFGLTVTEAMWKRKPVIASPIGGIALQLRDGEYGYFYTNPRESAEKVVYLLTHPQAADLMGKRSREYVREHFLLPDRIADCLKAVRMLMETSPDRDSIISFHSWHKLDKRK